jgi:preprotein translocase subunit SecG
MGTGTIIGRFVAAIAVLFCLIVLVHRLIARRRSAESVEAFDLTSCLTEVRIT